MLTQNAQRAALGSFLSTFLLLSTTFLLLSPSSSSGLQVTWMNFFKAAHGWSPGKSGGVLALFGVATAVFPRYLNPKP